MQLIRLPSFIITAVTAIILSMPCHTHADTIVNTGPGFPGLAGGYSLYNDGTSYQNLAMEFTLTSATNITSVEGWIVEYNSTGNLTIGIGTTPGDMLFSGTYLSQGMFGPSQWEGLTGLNWALESGTYWISFIANPGFSGAMPGGAALPLSKSSFANNYYPAWVTIASGYETDAFGIRILGEPQSVPDRGMNVIMLGAVLVGLAGLRRQFAR